MIIEAFTVTLQQEVKKRMLNPLQKQQVIAAMVQMFTNLRKRPVADLDARCARVQKRIELAVEGMSVEFVRSELVIKVAGSAELLLKEFRLGSDWFQPEPNVDKIILAAMMVDPKRS